MPAQGAAESGSGVPQLPIVLLSGLLLTLSAPWGCSSGTESLLLAPEPLSDVSDETATLQETTLAQEKPRGPWHCLGEPADEAGAPGSTVTYTFAVVSLVNGQIQANTAVRACRAVDLECAQPATPSLGPGSDGWIRVALPIGFEGYFEITADGLAPTRLYPGTRVTKDLEGGVVELLEPEMLEQLVGLAGWREAPNTTEILVRTLDCDGAPASGVEVSNDRGFPQSAVVGSLPVPGSVSGVEGLVVIGDVEPGFSRVRAALVETGELLRETSVASAAGWSVFLDVRP